MMAEDDEIKDRRSLINRRLGINGVELRNDWIALEYGIWKWHQWCSASGMDV